MKPFPIIYTTRAADQEALLLGLQRPVANEVAEAMRECRVRKQGDQATFFIGGDLAAVAARTRSTLGGRKAWIVTRVCRRTTLAQRAA